MIFASAGMPGFASDPFLFSKTDGLLPVEGSAPFASRGKRIRKVVRARVSDQFSGSHRMSVAFEF